MTSALEIASILFSSVAINHLGLVAAVEKVIAHRLPVINCPKCLSFWATLIYGCSVCCDSIAALPQTVALSLLCAWLAVWLDLAMGIIDHLYIKVYDTFYPTANPPDPDAPDIDNSLSVLPE